jgi:hypothetical protein
LKSEKVDGKRICTLKAQAAKPAGNHALVALFSDKKQTKFNEASVLKLFDGSKPKTLKLVKEVTTPHTVVKFNINS